MDFNALYLRTKFWINDFFKGSPIGGPYRNIKAILEGANGKALREEALEKMLTHAQMHTKFYSKYNTFNLQDYPVMNKTLLIENADALRVLDADIPGQQGEVFIQRTSGSTGTPFAVPQDTRKRIRRIADLKYFNHIVGFKSHEVLFHLRIWNQWQNKSQKQIKKENIYPFNIADMSESHLKELCEQLIATKAVAIRAYSSSFDLLSKYVMNHPEYKFPYLKIGIAGSESLGDDTRANVKKYLGCEIISQYADEECGILAQERIPTSEKDNVMYMNHADYYFEFLKLESDEPAEFGELARIVITDLYNYAHPMIRYDCGDVGVMLRPDKYSNGFPVLGKLYGRRLDVCFTTSGEAFSPMTIARTLKHYDAIRQWQFIQNAEKEYSVKLILTEGTDINSYMKEAVSVLKETLGEDAVINLLQVNDIPVMNSGKRKAVVNEWKKL